MGLFQKFSAGLQKTQAKLGHEIKRIFTGSPKLTDQMLDDLEAALISADLGVDMTSQIIASVKHSFETQGKNGLNVFAIARSKVEHGLTNCQTGLRSAADGTAIISLVGVNGTGKTTTAAKLAHMVQSQGKTAALAACDTFRAAAIEQIKIWGDRLSVPVIAGSYGADPAAVAHDAVSAAIARKINYLFIDTAGRLHTKHNLMNELQKLHRVIAKQVPGAPHETFLVLDASTGANALSQAREFSKAVLLTGLIVTKLDGTSKGGMIVSIQKELGLPVKFVGLGEQPDDLQPFNPKQFAEALFAD